jgi:hypothetical protein
MTRGKEIGIDETMGCAQPTSCGRLLSFHAIMACGQSHFEERLEPAAKRR